MENDRQERLVRSTFGGAVTTQRNRPLAHNRPNPGAVTMSRQRIDLPLTQNEIGERDHLYSSFFVSVQEWDIPNKRISKPYALCDQPTPKFETALMMATQQLQRFTEKKKDAVIYVHGREKKDPTHLVEVYKIQTGDVPLEPAVRKIQRQQ
jgi:hypothetical protein